MKSVNYSFLDLVDIDRIKDLLVSFYELTGIISVLEDLDGNILISTDMGWQDICLNFHRKHPETLKKCIKSDTKLSNGLKSGERYSCYTCLNGMVDMAVPIYIEGEHLANLFTGQFFLKQPDIEFFRKQAEEYGFDEEKYLNALSKVPVFPANFVEKSMSFLTDLANVIGEMGLEKKKLLDSKQVLQESEERYRIISQNTGDVIWLLDVNSGKFSYVSPSVKNLIGYTYNEILSRNIRDILTFESYKLVKNDLSIHIAALLSGDESARIMVHQVDQISKDNSTVPTEVVTTLLTNEEGQIDRILGVSRDITERKNADKIKRELLENLQQFTEELEVSNEELQATTEELMVSNEELQATTEELQAANEELREQGDELIQLNQTLRESEERYKALSLNSPDLIFRIDKELKFLYSNHGSNTLELSAEDLIGKDFKELPLPEETINIWVENINNTLINGEIREIEFEFPSIHGSRCFHSHIIPEYNAKGKIETLLLVNRDITKHKKAEIALKESEERFRMLINNSNDLIRILDEDGRIIFDSPSSKRILGYPEGYFIGKSPMEFIHPDDVERVKRDLQEVYEKQNPGIPTEFRIKKADGKYIPVESMSQNLTSVPGINGIVVTTHPIIDRKKNEKMLQFQADILNNVRDCVIVYDLHGKIIYWNKGAENIYGYAEEEIIGKNIKKLYLNVDEDQFAPDLKEILESGEYSGEWKCKRKDGSSVCVDIRETVMYDVNGKIIGVIGVSKDISERKKAEKQIKRSEAYYRTIFENTGTATIIIEEDTTVSLVNAEFEKLYGYPKEEIEGKISWKEFVSPDYMEQMEKYHNLRRIDPNLAPRNYEFQLIDRYGNIKDIIPTVAMIPGTKKCLISLLDVTDNKKAEKALRKSEAQLKIAMNMAKLAQWEYDVESDIFIFDDQFYALYGTTAEKEGSQMSYEEYATKFISPEDHAAVSEKINKSLRSDNPDYSGKIEHSIIRADGEKRFIAVHYEGIKDDDGRIIKTYGTNQDITEIKMAENKIRESLMEKEVLLREIHHRVKNNLQIISSLLNLQSRCVEEEETVNVLKESQNRVKTMAMVHEKLYQSEDLKDINFKEYIENLVSDLFYSYGVKIGTIAPQIHVEDLRIGITTAIPCGLIINELVTNSLKYAFPTINQESANGTLDHKGIVTVELKRLKDKFELIVSDNGVGLPKEVDMKNIETLGLKMVNILVNQLNGTLEVNQNEGTEFRIIFKELKYEDRI